LKEDIDLRTAISTLIGAGYQLDKEAFDFLKGISEKIDLNILVRSVIEEIERVPEKPLIIKRELLEKKAKDLYPSKSTPTPSAETSKTSFHVYAEEVETDLKVIDDPTHRIKATGSLEDYVKYFQDRLKRLSRIMKNRMDVKDASTILEAFKVPSNTKIKIICMITEKRESQRGIFLQVEDLEANATIFVPSEKHEVVQKAQRLMLDQVVCISAVKGKSNFLIADDVILPDVPLKTPNKASIPVYAALISDLHVGSKMFMGDFFENFVLWLKGKIGDNRLREIASHVKYIIIAGDVVDGVGIYPQQFEELEIKDLYKQYQAAAELIEQFPDYVEVVIIPGNHDATRRALPQPAISKAYAEPLYELERVHLLGDPSTLSLHGVNIFLSHGRSLDDVISTVPRMSFQAPEEAMRFLLQCRHLAPAYGLRTLIAPDKIDQLVIERVPDIFHAGHVHVMKYCNYRGILVVNSGAWQKQTEYQREMGHVPNPGIVPIVNLQNLQVTPVNFISAS